VDRGKEKVLEDFLPPRFDINVAEGDIANSA